MSMTEFTGTVTVQNNGGANYTYEGTMSFNLNVKDPDVPGSTLTRATMLLDTICDQLYGDNQSVTITGSLVGIDGTNNELLYTWNPNHPR